MVEMLGKNILFDMYMINLGKLWYWLVIFKCIICIFSSDRYCKMKFSYLGLEIYNVFIVESYYLRVIFILLRYRMYLVLKKMSFVVEGILDWKYNLYFVWF